MRLRQLVLLHDSGTLLWRIIGTGWGNPKLNCTPVCVKHARTQPLNFLSHVRIKFSILLHILCTFDATEHTISGRGLTFDFQRLRVSEAVWTEYESVNLSLSAQFNIFNSIYWMQNAPKHGLPKVKAEGIEPTLQITLRKAWSRGRVFSARLERVHQKHPEE